jgi:ribosomal protein S19
MLRGRRATWKLPFFVPFNLPKLSATPTATATATPAVATAPIPVPVPSSSKVNKKSKGQSQTSAPAPPTPVTMQLRTTARNCTILPTFVGHTFHVHNGRHYVPVKVTEEMIGYRLGEFAFTKKVAIFAGAKKV